MFVYDVWNGDASFKLGSSSSQKYDQLPQPRGRATNKLCRSVSNVQSIFCRPEEAVYKMMASQGCFCLFDTVLTLESKAYNMNETKTLKPEKPRFYLIKTKFVVPTQHTLRKGGVTKRDPNIVLVDY